MHDDVIRSLKESRRFERVSSDEVRDHIDSRWYELVFACGLAPAPSPSSSVMGTARA
jgi:hypothetical protein